MNRVLKWILIFVVLAGLAGGAVGAYAWLQNRDDGEPAFKTVEINKGSITEKALAIGQIEPRVQFRVKSKIGGIVKRCLVDIGDSVRPGDALFEIVPDPTPTELVNAQRDMESAQATYDLAQTDLRRTSELFAQKIIARSDVDARESEFERARIALEQSQDRLSLIKEGKLKRGSGRGMERIIRALSGGIVLARHVDPGDPVVPLTSFQAGTELATIADMGDLIFKGTVDEIDVGKLQDGLVARLKVGALPDDVVTGTLSRIAPQAIEKDGARQFEVEIELDPSEVMLRAGYSATVDLIIQEKTDIVLVPERLIHWQDDGSAYVETPPSTPEGEPARVDVEVGLSDGLNIEVVKGVTEGDQLVERPPREIG